ncbi:hypothetical protein Cadr_000015678 [Camelus dromedarius]|uniref:Uncharacterized protein n=1 Tax=Camelus dromedarius TaxID=9838 RepID=A0A5N4E9F5_CAMDR|nr:hypothetical protein Cadr_000015678 [Camelus dromedarius]
MWTSGQRASGSNGSAGSPGGASARLILLSEGLRVRTRGGCAEPGRGRLGRRAALAWRPWLGGPGMPPLLRIYLLWLGLLLVRFSRELNDISRARKRNSKTLRQC